MEIQQRVKPHLPYMTPTQEQFDAHGNQAKYDEEFFRSWPFVQDFEIENYGRYYKTLSERSRQMNTMRSLPTELRQKIPRYLILGCRSGREKWPEWELIRDIRKAVCCDPVVYQDIVFMAKKYCSFRLRPLWVYRYYGDPHLMSIAAWSRIKNVHLR